MTVKFFGQFLIERGELTTQQVRAALDLMESENRTLGELAVAAGFASAEELRRVNGVQRRRDARFGELAIQMGVLNSVELDELLQQQQRERLYLEDAIATLGFLPPERVALQLDAFMREQAPLLRAAESLPEALSGNRLAQCTVDMLPRFLRRVARIEVKLGPGRPIEEAPEMPLAASIDVGGNHGAHLALVTDTRFAEQLAVGVSGIDDRGLAAEFSADALGEFLNVLAGNAVSALEREGFEHRVAAPQFGVLPGEGFQFDAVATCGNALLVIRPHDD